VQNNPNDLTSSFDYVNPRGELLVAQAQSPRTEIVRLGNSWVYNTAAVACVTAIPTTTAPFYLWNGEALGGKAYIIDRIVWTCTTSAGVASMFSLVAMINKARVTAAPATADSAAVDTASGNKSYNGNATVGHTATVTNDNWFPIGQTFNCTLTATVGAQIEVLFDGGLILPPQSLLSIACVAANTTAVGKCAIFGHEVQIPVVGY
jgi:hypothetical protein